MNYRINDEVWNEMFRAYERQQIEHRNASLQNRICDCLPCSGKRLEIQRKADYEKELKEYEQYLKSKTQAKFNTDNALWAWM